MPTKRNPKRGGRGSNQYRARGAPSATLRTAQIPDERSPWIEQLDTERIAWAFHDPPRTSTNQAVAEARKVTDPAEVVRLAAHPNAALRHAAMSNPNLPQTVIAHLMVTGGDHFSDRTHIVSNPRCTPALILWAAENHPGETVHAAARAGQTPPEAIRAYLNAVVSPPMFKHVNCPEDLLRTGAKSSNGDVRSMVAGNPRTPKDLLRDLARDSNPEVRLAVAKNVACPRRQLKVLAADKDISVREQVAARTDVPYEAVEQLAEDDTRKVRLALAGNPAVAPVTLRRMSDEDPDARVAVKAAETLKSLDM